MLRRSQTLLLTFLTLAFTGLAVQAEAKDFVLEDWDGPAPVKNWYSNPSLDTKGWVPAVSDPLTFGTWTGATWWAPKGLYATAKFALFAGSGTGEWQWQAPGSSTVYRAEYGPAITRTVGCVNEGMRTSTGAWQPTVNGAPGWMARTSAHPTACTPGAWVPWTPSGQVFIGALGRQVFCSTSGCARTGSPTGNRAVFGVQRTRAVQPQFDAYLPGARLYLTDYDKPTVTAGTNSLSGWVNSGTGSVTATATDAGLGVKSVTITGPTPLTGSPATKTTTLSCTGDRNDRCPATWNTSKPNTTASLGYDVATLPEGINPFSATATDIVDNTSAANTVAIPAVKVDRTAPSGITTTGPLVDDEDHYFNGTDPVDVTVTASDPAATNGQALSGIKTIRIEEADGTVIANRTYDCTGLEGRCSATVNETLPADLNSLPEGAHQVRAVIVDQAGNVATGGPWGLYIDRTPPSVASDVTTDFDEDESTATASWKASDSDLSDGSPGSGLRSFTVRYTVNGATQTVTTPVPTVTLDGAHVGDSVSIEITGTDNAGNANAATNFNRIIAALPGCIDQPLDDPIPAGLLPGTPTQQADMFVLDEPVRPRDFVAGLPASAQLVSMLDRSPDPAAEYTSGILVPSNQTPSSALASWAQILTQDLDEEKDELLAARDNSTLPAYVAEVDRQIAQVRARQAKMTSFDGVPVRAFSVVHDPAVAAGIEARFAGRLSRGATVLPTADCGGTAGEPLDAETDPPAAAQRRSLASAARLTQPAEVEDYTANSYSPPYVRVRTQLDNSNDRHKVTVAWKYTAVSNLSYWRSPYRRSGTQRGTEVQVDMNKDGGGSAFGYPWWYNDPRPIDWGPAPPSQQNPTPGVWNANFRCAYPEDYFRDKRPNISLTIGMACRPNNIHKRYRWAHFVTAEDDNDRVTVSVAPEHYAKNDHLGGDVPILGEESEGWYCRRRDRRLGSCMYQDHGPAVRRYRLNAAAESAETPSNVVFRRRP